MASFGTHHIVNPFMVISERFGLALKAPSAHVIHECLTSSYRTPVVPPVRLPRGLWVVCGYGRFGRAVVEQLLAAGNTVRIIESEPQHAPPVPGTVIARGTEAPAQIEAGVREAVGIIAGTDNGINNLSIVVTARELNPRIFTVARQVSQADRLLFKHAGLDLRVRLTYLSATEAVEVLRNPLLPLFLEQLSESSEAWAASLLERLAQVIGDESPSTWRVVLTPEVAPALCDALSGGQPLTLGLMLREPRARDKRLEAIALLLRRQDRSVVLLPDDGFRLRHGDELLFCGRHHAQQRMGWVRHRANVLHYLATGVEQPSGWLWQWWARRRRGASG